MTFDRLSSQASAICAGVAWCFAAMALSRPLFPAS
jgi:hypothetical protein